MKDEIVKSITQAEETAAELKRTAMERATEIVDEAVKRAEQIENTAKEVCAAYRESQIKNAQAEAERAYGEMLAQNEEDAKEYCTKVLEGADSVIGGIVGRIISGNR